MTAPRERGSRTSVLVCAEYIAGEWNKRIFCSDRRAEKVKGQVPIRARTKSRCECERTNSEGRQKMVDEKAAPLKVPAEESPSQPLVGCACQDRGWRGSNCGDNEQASHFAIKSSAVLPTPRFACFIVFFLILTSQS